MLTPPPEQTLTFTPAPRRMRVLAAGHVIADTTGASFLYQDGAWTVFFPTNDVEMGFLSQTDKVTHCERKGDAAHYSMLIDGELLENVAYSYRNPSPEADGLRNLITFDPSRVEVYEVSEGDLQTRHHPHTGPATSLP